MCGIVGYVGKREAQGILTGGLRRLEYRGYDSAGIVTLDAKGKPSLLRAVGKVFGLDALVQKDGRDDLVGIGHTRWATHGIPSERNAHPHKAGDIYLVHNGIIENYATLKEALIKLGSVFKSDTDTEVLIHLIEDIQQKENLRLGEAVRVALNQVVGAYAIVILSKNKKGGGNSGNSGGGPSLLDVIILSSLGRNSGGGGFGGGSIWIGGGRSTWGCSGRTKRARRTCLTPSWSIPPTSPNSAGKASSPRCSLSTRRPTG